MAYWHLIDEVCLSGTGRDGVMAFRQRISMGETERIELRAISNGKRTPHYFYLGTEQIDKLLAFLSKEKGAQ